MENLTDHPLLVFVITFAAMWLATIAGSWFRDRRPLTGDERHSEFEIILAATLTLLALIIGFSVSMAAGRYDQRMTLEEAEARTIGTEYVRADFLPAPDAARVRLLLGDYVHLRILFFTSADNLELMKVNQQTGRLQSSLWAAVREPAKSQSTPATALSASGMNDVLDSEGDTRAAFWNRIPLEAWGLMAAVGLCCNLMIGYGAQNTRAGKEMALIMPLILATAFLLIADIDAPRHGLTRVYPRDLIALANSLGR